MIYSKMVNKAINIAYIAHSGQLDASGLPYFMHPLHLAEHFYEEDLVITALLHDVVEDTDVTLTDLEDAGFSPEVITALSLLTHKKDVPYADYIDALKNNRIARKVKIADLTHNMDQSRCPSRSEYFIKKTRDCYLPAYKLLTEIDKAEDK